MRTLTLFLILSTSVFAFQSGNRPAVRESSVSLNAIIQSSEGQEALANLTTERLMLFDGGIQQHIEYLRPDRSAAKIVILVDNSQTLRTEPVKLKKIVKEFCNELFEGDEVMIIGFNESADILEDFTGDLKRLHAATEKFQRKGLPKLYDAIAATIEDAFRKQIGVSKRVILLLSDGYDRGSQVKFEQVMDLLLDENILLYSFQTPDRTYGGIRSREAGPKPVDAITKLTENTGGALFKLEDTPKVEEAAKQIAEEIKRNWFRISYTPQGISTINARRILLTSGDEKLTLRTKKVHPAQYRN